MPLLQITTNVSVDDAAVLAKAASRLTADLLSKPESYVMVHINAGAQLWFAGSDEPAAHIKLKSLGLPEASTGKYSAALCDFIEQHLGVPPGRTYIEFSGPPRHLWGWNSSTF
jgi:phenylpyruvate tautomerase PptA (4-oxalocrotonate tautomerase family)